MNGNLPDRNRRCKALKRISAHGQGTRDSITMGRVILCWKNGKGSLSRIGFLFIFCKVRNEIMKKIQITACLLAG